jgi:undecaprenyl-diphosphatase
MDTSLYETINGFAARHDGLEDVLRFFALDAQYFFIALLAILFLARGKWASQNARHGVVAAGFSAALALAIAQVISHIWERPRPYIAHPDIAHLFITPAGDPSFPSDHATAAFAIAVAILLRSRKVGLLALGMATVLAVARVAVGTHYPGDVLGGALLGTLCAFVFYIPAVRAPLHRLADWASGVYGRVVARVTPRPRSAR